MHFYAQHIKKNIVFGRSYLSTGIKILKIHSHVLFGTTTLCRSRVPRVGLRQVMNLVLLPSCLCIPSYDRSWETSIDYDVYCYKRRRQLYDTKTNSWTQFELVRARGERAVMWNGTGQHEPTKTTIILWDFAIKFVTDQARPNTVSFWGDQGHDHFYRLTSPIQRSASQFDLMLGFRYLKRRDRSVSEGVTGHLSSGQQTANVRTNSGTPCRVVPCRIPG